MSTTDPRSLLKLLTSTCMQAMLAAAERAVHDRHREVTAAHLLRVLLDDACSDVSVIFARHRARDAAIEILDGALGALPGDVRGKPVIASSLLLLIEDTWTNLCRPRADRRVRSGALLAQLARDPARFEAAPLLSKLSALTFGLSDYSQADLAPSREGAESRVEVPRAAPRHPREVHVHTVFEGETLIEIARRFAIDVEDAARDNHLGVRDQLTPGASLRLRVLAPEVLSGAPGARRHVQDPHGHASQTEISAHSLVTRVIELMALVPDPSRRNEHALRDDPRLYHRLKQIEALLRAFEIPPLGEPLESELIDSLRRMPEEDFRLVCDGEPRGAIVERLRRLDPLEIFIQGYSLLTCLGSRDVMAQLRPYAPGQFPPPGSEEDDLLVCGDLDLQAIWQSTFAFRRAAQGVIDFNAGWLAAAGWRRAALNMTGQVIRELRASLHPIDGLLADIVDPARRVFSREEMVRDHGFTDVDLLQLDMEGP